MLITTDSHILRKAKYWGNIGVYPIKYLKIAEGKDVIEIKTETTTWATTFTHLDVSTIESKKPDKNTDTIVTVIIVANLTVVFVFLNHRKLRRKVPNICIINQVSFISLRCPQLSSVNNCNNVMKIILKLMAHDFVFRK